MEEEEEEHQPNRVLAVVLLRVTVFGELQEEKEVGILAEVEHRAQPALVCVVILAQAPRPIRAAALIILCLHFAFRVVAPHVDIYQQEMELPAAEVVAAEITVIFQRGTHPAVTEDPEWCNWPGLLHRQLHMLFRE